MSISRFIYENTLTHSMFAFQEGNDQRSLESLQLSHSMLWNLQIRCTRLFYMCWNNKLVFFFSVIIRFFQDNIKPIRRWPELVLCNSTSIKVRIGISGQTTKITRFPKSQTLAWNINFVFSVHSPMKNVRFVDSHLMKHFQ